MADNQKYYYMRLKESFFDDDSMKILEGMNDGFLFSNILLKMYLVSLKTDGRLMFNDFIPYNAEMIASITRHQVGTVERALQIFRQMGLIEVLDNGAIYMLDVQNFVGKGSTEADRIREYRRRIAVEKNESVEMYEKSTPESVQMYEKCTPEIEIETEIELYTPPISPPQGEKKGLSEEDFNRFWQAYPKKVAKQAAKKAFMRIKGVGIDVILSALAEQKRSSQWSKDDGQYIPHPATWINQGRWEDEVMPEKSKHGFKERSKSYDSVAAELDRKFLEGK